MSIPVEPSSISWRTPGARGYTAIALVVIGLIITVRTLIPTIGAAMESDEVEQAEAFDVERQRAQHGEEMTAWVSVVQGRSPFFIPPAPIIEEPPPPPDPKGDEDEKPTAPTRYAGPDIIGAMNGQIWLDNDTTVALGEEGSVVTLLSLENVPWSVRVEWRGAEFDVDLFEDTTTNFLSRDRDGE